MYVFFFIPDNAIKSQEIYERYKEMLDNLDYKEEIFSLRTSKLYERQYVDNAQPGYSTAYEEGYGGFDPDQVFKSDKYPMEYLEMYGDFNLGKKSIVYYLMNY